MAHLLLNHLLGIRKLKVFSLLLQMLLRRVMNTLFITAIKRAEAVKLIIKA
nr:MAG TPA: hypothetical protein [Bacteriophage sp.]